MSHKKQQGFTLVEVIVVAVIVAVLAAVAIPLYMGYIRDSRSNVCKNTAATIASAFVAKIAQTSNASGYTPATQGGGAYVSIPSESDASIYTNINLPTGYTYSVADPVVTVNGPGGSYSTCNYR